MSARSSGRCAMRVIASSSRWTGRRIIGYIYGYIGQNPPIYPQARFGFIADLCVTQSQRRRGVGERLVREVSTWFRLRGLDSVQMNVAHHNPLSTGLLAKDGQRGLPGSPVDAAR